MLLDCLMLLAVLQVFDLSEYRPDTVLKQIWKNLEKLEQQGNQRAAVVRSRLRILACGGDGTMAWILKVIQQLDLQPPPPVAIMPLGTGKQRRHCVYQSAVCKHRACPAGELEFTKVWTAAPVASCLQPPARWYIVSGAGTVPLNQQSVFVMGQQ